MKVGKAFNGREKKHTTENITEGACFGPLSHVTGTRVKSLGFLEIVPSFVRHFVLEAVAVSDLSKNFAISVSCIRSIRFARQIENLLKNISRRSEERIILRNPDNEADSVNHHGCVGLGPSLPSSEHGVLPHLELQKL